MAHAGGAMKTTLLILFISACVAVPCLSAPERFTADKPTPLKQTKPGKEDGNAVRFSGSVQLSGQFLVIWERVNQKPVYRRITFFPDPGSTALLPHAAGSEPVKELLLTNSEQAGPMLLDLLSVQKPLAGDRLGSEGAAIVTIRDYRTVVECDHRWYLAQLVSVKKNREIVVSARDDAHSGC
jgi:hypothetical protein